MQPTATGIIHEVGLGLLLLGGGRNDHQVLEVAERIITRGPAVLRDTNLLLMGRVSGNESETSTDGDGRIMLGAVNLVMRLVGAPLTDAETDNDR